MRLKRKIPQVPIEILHGYRNCFEFFQVILLCINLKIT
jgi:hypothetical protein